MYKNHTLITPRYHHSTRHRFQPNNWQLPCTHVNLLARFQWPSQSVDWTRRRPPHSEIPIINRIVRVWCVLLLKSSNSIDVISSCIQLYARLLNRYTSAKCICSKPKLFPNFLHKQTSTRIEKMVSLFAKVIIVRCCKVIIVRFTHNAKWTQVADVCWQCADKIYIYGDGGFLKYR